MDERTRVAVRSGMMVMLLFASGAALAQDTAAGTVSSSLSGLPLFLAYFCLSLVVVAAYLYAYTHITQHDELELIQADVPGAAISLGLSLLGFALPVASAIAHAANIVDCIVWSVVALIVQVIVYYLFKHSAHLSIVSTFVPSATKPWKIHSFCNSYCFRTFPSVYLTGAYRSMTSRAST